MIPTDELKSEHIQTPVRGISILDLDSSASLGDEAELRNMTACQHHSTELNNYFYKMQGEGKSSIFRIRILTSIYHTHLISISLPLLY